MFDFLQTIFTKITSLVASVIIAVGLISAPAPQVEFHQVELSPQIETVIEAKQELQQLKSQKELSEFEQAKAEAAKIKIEAEKARKEAETARRKMAEDNLRKQQEEQARQMEQQKIQQELDQQNLLSCNGKNWLPCTADQIFYCPAIGDAQCILKNTQAPTKLSGVKDCMQWAIEQYHEAQMQAEAAKKQCEVEYNYPPPGTTESIICMIRGGGVSELANYFSDCVGSSQLPSSESTYSPPSYSPTEIPSISEEMKKREICDLVDGIFLNGKCY